MVSLEIPNSQLNLLFFRVVLQRNQAFKNFCFGNPQQKKVTYETHDFRKPLRKLSNTQARASSSKASSIADESENDCNESIISQRSHPESASSRQASMTSTSSMIHGRSDSIDSTSIPSAQPGGRRFVKNVSKKPSDLMEVNFSPPNSKEVSSSHYNSSIGGSSVARAGSNNSVDSSQRSRAPSFISHRATDSSSSGNIVGVVEEDDDDDEVPAQPEVQMHEVKCFIKNDDEIFYAMMKERDTSSLYSTKTESSMPYFETIEENVSTPASPRSNSQLSRKSLEPKSPTDPMMMMAAGGTLKGRRKESTSAASTTPTPSRLLPPPSSADTVTYVLIGVSQLLKVSGPGSDSE